MDALDIVTPFDMLLGGEFVGGGGPEIAVHNPATEQLISTIHAADHEQVTTAVMEAAASYDRGLGTPQERADVLRRLADLLERNAEEIVELSVAEVGTPVSTARTLHLALPVETLRWLAEATVVDRTERLGRARGPVPNEAIVLHRPVGVVAAITAYNYPVHFAAMKVGSAFAAGCPTVLLPSAQAPLSTLLFARLAVEAGFPQGALSVVAGGVETAKDLISRPEIAKVTFTGSVSAGEDVMRQAAIGIRGVVLELGGKSAAVLLPSSDPVALAGDVHRRYLRNAGQGCASPTRILVHEDALEGFVEASRLVFDEIAVGDPMDERTLVGPVISAAHRDRVNDFISEAVHSGGRILAQAPPLPEGPGWWVRPTLLGDLPTDARINQHEVFGPVATVLTYRDVDEAVRIAESTTYGLHTSVFGDTDEALALAPRFRSGLVTINGGGPVRPDAPNGGWKQSGVGRERGEAGIREFLEPVTVQWTV